MDYFLIEKPLPSEFYKSAFMPSNTSEKFDEADKAIEAFFVIFHKVFRECEGKLWVVMFSNSKDDVDVTIALDNEGEILNNIFKLSIVSKGYLDDFVALSPKGDVICISKNEYDYSVIHNTSDFFMDTYLSLTS